ncbi:hypothetical protein MKX08_008185 [Trichoderma sp. CBMAI-0020]|nr:hypothetical protein MKX08_008185 [Trichoderma sp. CBMAI-0020]WOD46320.1 hypothetical protein [Trichoderma atroviride]
MKDSEIISGPKQFPVRFRYHMPTHNVLWVAYRENVCLLHPPGVYRVESQSRVRQSSAGDQPGSEFYHLGILPVADQGDWLAQRLFGRNGDPQQTGLAIWLFNVHKDKGEQTAFSSLDGEARIVPQIGALDITTGFDKILGHFRLPELGISRTGLANSFDFQIPKASFQGGVEQGPNREQVAVANNGSGSELYPYKYDLARVDTIANIRYGQADLSVFVVLTAPSLEKPLALLSLTLRALGLTGKWRETLSQFHGIIATQCSSSFSASATTIVKIIRFTALSLNLALWRLFSTGDGDTRPWRGALSGAESIGHD